MYDKRAFLVIALLVTLVLSLAACGGGNKPTSEPAATNTSNQQSTNKGDKIGEIIKVTIAFPSAGSLSGLPVAAADQQGYFKEEGLEVEFPVVKPPVAIPAIVADEIDYTIAMGSSIAASMQGIPIRVILVMTGKPMHYLMVQKGIDSLQGLKNKVVAINAVGDLTDIELQEALKMAGMQYNDVKVIAISGAQEKIAAMDSGQVVAGVLEMPHNILAVEKGYTQLESFADVLPAGPGGLSTSIRKLQENPDEVLKVVRATLRGTQWLKKNKDQAVALIQEWSKYDREVATKAYEQAMADDVWPSNGQATQVGIEASIKAGRNQAKIPADKEIPLDQVFDFAAAKKVTAELGIK